MRKKPWKKKRKKRNYVRRERVSPNLLQESSIAEKVQSDNAKASLNNGILEITLPKKEPKETKKLAIE